MCATAIEGVGWRRRFHLTFTVSLLSAFSDATALGRGVPTLAVGDRTIMIGRTGIIEF
jgi:hypothetical protein